MSDSEELITSDEDDASVSGSEESGSETDEREVPSRDVTVEDSDSDRESDAADESVIGRPRQRIKKRVVIESESEGEEDDDDDDEDDDEEMEERVLSARTRMSITGIRPADLTDDSSEIEYSDEEEQARSRKTLSLVQESASETLQKSGATQSDVSVESSGKTNSYVEQSAMEQSVIEQSAIEQSMMEQSAIEQSAMEQSAMEQSAMEQSALEQSAMEQSAIEQSSTEQSPTNRNSDSDAEKTEDEEIDESQDTAGQVTPNVAGAKRPNISAAAAVQSPMAAPRYSMHFESAIKEKLSSTIYQHRQEEVHSSNSSNDSDIQIINTKEKTIEIFSTDDEADGNAVPANTISRSTPIAAAKIKPPNSLVQPKINAALPKAAAIKAPATSATLKVTREFYAKEAKKLDDLKLETLNAERLLEKIAKSLPDGGIQLTRRIERLRHDLEIKAKYVATLQIDDGGVTKSEFKSPNAPGSQQQQQRKAFFLNDAPDWNELSADVNKIQPTHTGRQGMATFNAQKSLTVERLKDLHGSLESCPGENVLADDPKGLKVTLMDHQKHALAWMTWREKQKPSGGILADDMGLGKTLTMISMVLACKNRSEIAEEDEGDDAKDSDSDAEEKENQQGWTSKGRRDYYPGGTLVVCPASLMRQWEGEVQSKITRNKLTVCVHHGNNRDTKPKHLRTYDIVVTTYQIATREQKTQGALFGIRWRRIILDEAHMVRNHKAQMSLAVCGLRGKYRWALTGTPIQNKELDVYALLKFLRCSPFDDFAHWKKWIDNKSAGGQQRLNTVMKSLMLRRTKVQLQERGELKCLPKKVIELIEVNLDKDEMNVYQKIMIYSRSLFAQFLFQRAERNSDLAYSDQGNRPTFMQTKDPNGAYYKMHQKFTRMHAGSKDVKSHEILVLLLRLRQICCHPGLIDAMLEDDDAQNIESDDAQPEIDLLEQLNNLDIKDSSGGANSLLSNSREDDPDRSMRPEEANMAKASARVLQRNNPVFDLKRPSSKMNKVLETLRRCVLETGDKAIVVSQWTSVLNILKVHLEGQRIHTLSLDGSIPVKNRQTIVTEFNNANSKVKVLLLSLTAGGVGLNLVGANHLLLIDLHWNPQLEAQAQDRIYRVGQKKDVIIYKFMCKDTVEERIKMLQDRKMAIADGVLTGAKAEGTKLSMEDLRGLFGM